MDQNISTSEVMFYIQDPSQVIFEGKVKAVSTFNEVGIFDVLPLHENFISIIKEAIYIKEVSGGKREIKISQGILKVYRNSVYIFLDVETLNTPATAA